MNRLARGFVVRPLLVAIVAVGLSWPVTGGAIEPADVFIIVNRNVPQSQAVADHYCRQRGVPAENIVPLDLPDGEDISRREYDDRLAGPLRLALAERREQAKVLLTVWGVPLRVGPQEPTAEEQAAGVQYDESHAAVDSELALLWWGAYELRRWQANPLYFQVPDEARQDVPATLMVSRLDGPTPELAMRLVDQALAAEKDGLAGRVYVDARGIAYDPAQDRGFGYGGYDESLREMASLLKDAGGMDVTLDDQPDLFSSGSCPDAALYCGWYSLARYVDSCRFVPGAVAWHIASAEAVSLRDPNCAYWCKNLLDQGACATIGPVAEPYTIGFPKPAEFFGLLVTGQYPLVECYARTHILTSWMMVLVGDPLYNPFAHSPRLKPDQVPASPAGAKFRLVPRR
jgi:uncharacterized protein (TIGR03790 family)